MWGCSDEDAAKIKPHHRTLYRLGSYETHTCPHRLFRQPLVSHALELYGAYSNGLLPQDGGWRSQTRLYREVMITIQRHDQQAAAWYQEQTKDDR